MIPPTISPAPSCSTSSNALCKATKALFLSKPFSNLALASVRIPSFLAVFLMDTGSKYADSNTTVFVSSIIPLYSPPITPATPIGLFASAIISISSESMRSMPSRVVIFSLFIAFLILISAPSTYLKSKACIGCPYSSIT